MRTYLILAFFIAAVVVVSGCSGSGPDTSSTAVPESTATPASTDSSDTETDAASSETAEPAKPLWLTAELKDVASGETFTIDSFAGKTVVFESFAVWCPICTRQQQESKKLEELMGDSIVSVSLDTDPNENEENVRTHITRHGFDWNYAVASSDVTASLIDSFGLTITSVPLAPMVVVCPDQSAHRLRNGVKSASELQSSVSELCGI